MKRIFSCAVIMLALCSCAFAADKYIVLENIDGEGRTRDEAIQAAWLEGIRQAVGSYIDSKTELNNDQLTERIIAYNRGLVERYEITGVDDSRAGEGVYRLTMKLWILQDVLRDGAKHVTSGSAEISFSPEDVKRRREELDAKALEARNAQQETSRAKSTTGAELLSAMLNRYKPEDFLTCYIPGKPEPVKDKPDTFRLNVEVNINEKLYKESFVPDFEQVMNQIAAVKKNTMLVKQKTELRNLASKKDIPNATDSVIFRTDGLGGEYTLAVYDKPERFGVRLYGFRNDDKEKIHGELSAFITRTLRVQGLVVELQDEDKETIETIEQKFSVKFLMSEASGRFSVHPTIINTTAKTENSRLVVPVMLDLPEEVLPYVKFFRVSLLIGEVPGWLGVNFIYGSNREALVAFVYSGSPAEKGGLKQGDVVAAINGEKVKTSLDAEKIISKHKAGDVISITLKDGGKRSVTLGAKK